jgi:hypothetical protein
MTDTVIAYFVPVLYNLVTRVACTTELPERREHEPV